MNETRWLAIGHATGLDSDAGRRAAEEALVGDDAKLLVVFCSDSYDLPALVRAVNEQSGGVPLVGCSTAGEIATNGPRDASVVITALGGPGFSITTAVARGASTRLHDAGAEAAACFEGAEPREHRVMMLLTDGLAGDQQEIVRGAHSVLGAAVPLVGGCAGDDLKMQRTFQLYGDEALTDAVIGIGIASDAPFGIGVRHGWRRVGEPMLVTRSGGNRVFELDDEPALDVYLDRLGAPPETRSDGEALTRFALTHPLGLSRRTGEDQVRFVGGADFGDSSLSCIAEVPEGAMVWIMEGDEESVLSATEAACADSLVPLGDHPPLGLIAFDCIARRGVLGDVGIRAEIDAVAARAGGAPVSGFYTYGEIARTHGVSGFHNQTLVVLALA